MVRTTSLACVIFALALSATPAPAQHSLARQWNEVLLESIRGDFARPTANARNLFHTSIALYDAWAAYSDGPEQPYLLGKTIGGFTCSFSGVPRPDDVEAARRGPAIPQCGMGLGNALCPRSRGFDCVPTGRP